MYDIIGDIHGHADQLEQLLIHLGYEPDGRGYRHPDRLAVFVGDLIDRGPRIADTLAVVRAMVESGSALLTMGNHEFNAIAFHTRAHDRPGGFLREHSDKNYHQHQATLRQLSAYELADYVDWFRTLPMWLDLDGIRVVHACWSPDDIGTIEERLNIHGGVTDAFMHEATDKLGQSALYRAVEHVLKGPEYPLPEGRTYSDKEGTIRRDIRVRWFVSPAGLDLADYAIPALPDKLGALSDDYRPAVTPYGEAEPPVFFGHYWLTGTPLVSSNAACLDYSVAKGGPLMAYRWSGERQLGAANLVWVNGKECAKI